jgi:hypothetical protein
MRPASTGTRGETFAKFSFSPKGAEVYRIYPLSDSEPQPSTGTGPPPPTLRSVSPLMPMACPEDRIERALEDDYLSRDPSISKRAAYIRRTMEKARKMGRAITSLLRPPVIVPSSF